VVRDSPRPFAVLYPGEGSPDNAVLRCLGEAGVPVAVATSRRFNANCASRYCRRVFRVPPPEDGAGAIAERLVEIARELGSTRDGEPVLFMLHDFAVMLGSKYRGRLSAHYRGHFPEPDVLETCNRHDQMYEAASEAGVPAPRTALWPGTGVEDLERMPPPWVVKPVSKYVLDGGGLRVEPFRRRFGRKAFRANSPRELRALLGSAAEAGVPVVVQEYVPGDVGDLVTVVLYVAGGRVLAHGAGRKLRQTPPDCGTCTYGESCSDAEDAVRLAERLVDAIGYEGIAEVEFKRDRRDGRLKLMELNPRPTVFCMIADAQGVNLPLAAYDGLAGVPARTPARVAGPNGRVVRWMDPYRDLLECRRGGPFSVVRWLREASRADVLLWGSRRDPVPLLVAPVQGVFEWLGERRRPARRSALGPPKGPSDGGYVDYWQQRSGRTGLSAVMWSNDEYNVLADRAQKRVLDRALGDVRGRKVLDLACGTGRLSVHLARRGAEVVGVDLACMADAARTANPHPRVTYLGCGAESLDFPPGTFDVIFSVGSLAACICDTPAKLSEMGERLRRLLTPGGVLVLLEPFHVCPGLRRSLCLSPRAARARFRLLGLRLVRSGTLLFLPGRLVMSKAWWRAPRALTACLFTLGEGLLRVPGTGALSDYKMFVLAREQE